MATRERQEQRIGHLPEQRPRWVEFGDGTQFVGYLGKQGKMLVNGDIELTITVPYQFKHLATCLSDVMGLPLSIDVQLWKPYETRQKERELNAGTQVV